MTQTVQPARIICVDDGSTDGSVALIGRYATRGVELVRNEKRLGLPGNWNRAAALVGTPYFVIAHQDDIYEPSYLSRMAALLDAHPRAFIAHCRAMYIDDRSARSSHPSGLFKDRFWSREEPQQREPQDELRVLSEGDYIICPSVLYRTDRFLELGDFDERYSFVPDWAYWIRGLAAGHTIVGTHEQLMRYRYHSASATREHEKSLRRFEEELLLADAIAEHMHGKQHRRKFVAVKNTLLSEFTFRLAAGDISGGRKLVEFGRQRIPGFRSSPHGLLMSVALYGGRLAGRLLTIAQNVYVRIAPSRH